MFVRCGDIALFIKKYLASRMSREKSLDQLICRGVGQNVSPRERTDISSVDEEHSNWKVDWKA